MNPDPSDPLSLEERAIRLYADYLARVEQGEDVDLESLCAEHPDLAPPLRALAPMADALSRAGRIEPPLAELAGARPASSRYEVLEELARGGMGAIMRVWDRDIRRFLAMKVALLRDVDRASSSPATRKTLSRFFEEAQITGQLDHPGVVPVHELGLDEQGQLFFTMRLVKGRTFREIIQRVHDADESWTQVRALGVVLKVAEALAFAHSKGVVHRDLKPSNVMVGRFGEVYVMDWGLARVLGEEEQKDIRLQASVDTSQSRIESKREQVRESDSDSPLLTMDGDVVGTPAYMAPEQAAGDIDNVGVLSDVYALGAVLYHLLAGQVPYVGKGVRVPGHTILRWVLEGPPRSITETARDAPAELQAICEKAMAREPAQRYASMDEMAEDLRAYLEHRVVRAHKVGAVAEFTKWMQRNRGLAAASAAAILAVVLGLGFAVYLQEVKVRELQLETDFRTPAHLARVADELWPLHPRRISDLERWLVQAEDLISRRESHVKLLRDAGIVHARDVGPLDSNPETFELAKLVKAVGDIVDDDAGLLADVRSRLAFARTVEELTVTGPEAARRWREAIVSIADPEQCPAYQGLEIEPQIGLIPIGQDPDSGLWEFAHLQTGEVPERDTETGALEIAGESCLVFVLIPGGTFTMGAQRDPGLPNFNPRALDKEQPLREIDLAAFLLSKYEMTQGQWLRVSGENPSLHQDEEGKSLVYPVESVSWVDCVEIMRRLGLVLPTEARWEYAARAGTSAPWWTGSERGTLEGAANLADRAARQAGFNWPALADWPELDDGFAAHAPVYRLRANPFGLHHVHGNLLEWCLDGGPYVEEPREGDGYRAGRNTDLRVGRGGSYDQIAAVSSSSHRTHYIPNYGTATIGLRPARALENTGAPPR